MSNAKLKCKSCGDRFPRDQMKRVSGVTSICKENVECQVKYALKAGPKLTQQRQKKHRADIRKRKDALRTKPEQEKITQDAVNGWCNVRDRLRGYSCVSCDRPLLWGVSRRYGGSNPATGEAGHYRSVGSARHLRFLTFNINGQCQHCNSPRGLSGHHRGYEQGIIKRYGHEMLDRIKADQRPRKYTIDDLKRIARIFRRRTRHYKKLLKNRED